MKLALLLFFSSVVLIAQAFETGKVPPLVPSSYRSNAIQNKFNHNGATCPPASPSPGSLPCVNHTMSQTIYSSIAQNMLRTDSGAFENNIPIGLSPGNLVLSLIDFNKKPQLNTFVELPNVLSVTCNLYNASWLPPLPDTFLQTLGAIYAGTEYTTWAGLVARWTLLGTTSVEITFYFNGPSLSSPVGWQLLALDKTGGQQQVAVNTQFYNYQPGEVNPSVFAGAGSCANFPQTVDPAAKAHRQPVTLMEMVATPHPIHLNQVLPLVLSAEQIRSIFPND